MQSTMIGYLIGAYFLVTVSAVQLKRYVQCERTHSTGIFSHITSVPVQFDGTIQSVELTPCDAEPCYLKRGTNVTISIHFTSNVDTSNVTISVHGILANFIHVPWLGIPVDSCSSHDMDHCPIKAGETHIYHTVIHVSPKYPLVRVTVQFELKDENHDIVCFYIPTEIVA